MGIFFDPIKKKPKTWVFVAFICVPIFLIVFSFIFGNSIAKKKAIEDKEESPDEFFKKFNPK